MVDAERVYAEFVEARSFGCKRCGYTSTKRRVVEQHLRTNHPQLFGGTPPSPAEPAKSPSLTRGEDPTPSSLAGPPGGESPSVGITRLPQTSEAASAYEGAGGLGQEVIFYTDAGTWDNGTNRQHSVLAVWDSRKQGIVVHEDLPGTTNNEAEYAAIIAALELARHDRLAGLRIRSDSELCVKQIKGEYQVKEERLRPLRDRAARLLKELRGSIEWVPRGRNQAGIFLEKQYKR